VPIGDVAKRVLVFLQLARVTNSQFFIAVQDDEHTLAYKIHEFLVRVRY